MSFKVGLALGGGAARGLAHLGVLKALQDADIPVDIITGTSIGAVIGTIYADSQDAYEVIAQLDSYFHSPRFNKARLDFIRKSDQEKTSYFGQFKKFFKTSVFFAISMANSSFISEEGFKNNLETIIPKKNIEDLPISLGLVCMDIDTAEEIVFYSGRCIDRVMSSCAIPGIFPPVKYGKRLLIDGSWVNPVPVDIARQLGANLVIAVDVAPVMSPDISNQTGWNIILKSSEASRIALKSCRIKEADVVIPINLNEIHWADFLQYKKCILEGEATAKAYLSEIKRKMFWNKLKPRLPG